MKTYTCQHCEGTGSIGGGHCDLCDGVGLSNQRFVSYEGCIYDHEAVALLFSKAVAHKLNELTEELHRMKHPTTDDMTAELPTKPGLYWSSINKDSGPIPRIIGRFGRRNTTGLYCWTSGKRVKDIKGLWLEIPEVKVSEINSLKEVSK